MVKIRLTIFALVAVLVSLAAWRGSASYWGEMRGPHGYVWQQSLQELAAQAAVVCPTGEFANQIEPLACASGGGGATGPTGPAGPTGPTGANCDSIGTYASLPASGASAGCRYISSDSPYSFIWTGSAWQAYILSYPVSIPKIANYTIVNQGTATIGDSNAGVYINDNAASDNWRMVVESAPTPPYAVVFMLSAALGEMDYTQAAALWRDSGSGKISIIAIRNGADVQPPIITTTNWSSPTTYVSGNGTNTHILFSYGTIFFKLQDDGTTVYFYSSTDGVNWLLHYSVAKSSGYLGSTGYNQIGVGLDPASGAGQNEQVTWMGYVQSTS